ncbi:hypothetical protein, partial [Ralstonia solanacearum]|uniref:hypothetical protein n=1 Tax=Ralstonia solanacearum TaxID=305 RepID=UPI001E3B40EC
FKGFREVCLKIERELCISRWVEPKEDAVSYATSIQRFAPRDAFRAERPVAGLHIIFDFALFTLCAGAHNVNN